MITWLRRLLLTCTILGLLATNVLTLTSAGFNAALSGFMSTALGVTTVSEAFQSNIAKEQAAAKTRKVVARKFGTRLASRTKRVAAASVAAIPAEAIPFLDVGVLVAGCSGLMKPDTNMGGKIATREVFNGKTKTIIFNRIQA